MAAPTVRDIFLDILPYLGVEPDYGSEDIRGVNFTVPDVIGMDETEAGELLAEKTITYRVVGTGSVVTDQLPVAGSQVPGNSQIILYMGAEKQATRVEVPISSAAPSRTSTTWPRCGPLRPGQGHGSHRRLCPRSLPGYRSRHRG
ncbi:MAG: PASTA domain-containing protein [Oscillospiraceae bacterium]